MKIWREKKNWREKRHPRKIITAFRKMKIFLKDTLLFAARFLWHKIQASLAPPGVSKVYILYAFAKISRQLGAYKTARYCYR